MTRLVSVVVLVAAATSVAQGPTGPSDDPAPAEGLPTLRPTPASPTDAGVSVVAPKSPEPKSKSTDDKDRPRGSQGFVEARGGGGEMHFGGFDFGFTTFFSSGLYFAPEAYTGSLTFWLEPSWSFGRRFLKDTWFEPMLLTVRLPVEIELTGNDGRFRAPGFSSTPLFTTPDGAATLAPQAGLVDGPTRRPVLLGDTWVNLIHGKVFTIPVVGISMANSLRVALPTSIASRNTGFVSSLSLGFIFDKTLGPVHLTYVFRPAKYFYERAVSEIRGEATTVEINGKQERTWRPTSTGVANPNVGFINGLSASVELPLGFSVSASYFLFNILPYELGGCAVPGLAQQNPCGPTNAFGGSQWRNDQWFLASVDWSRGPVNLSLGLSTFRGVNGTDGKVTQPFIEVNRQNATTLYLSFSTSAEQLVSSFTEEKK